MFFQLKGQSAEISSSNILSEYDTAYIQTFPNQINARVYLSRKFTELSIEERQKSLKLDYKPNTSLNFGVGATYNGFTLNLAYGFRFLNEEKQRGETQYLDLQTHIYGRKYALDLYGQFYFGMYLDNTSDILTDSPEPYYLRPDARILVMGASYFRIANSKRFSFGASMEQNEWQKKSAGSFLWGGKFILMGFFSDSSMVPSFQADSLFSSIQNIQGSSSLQIGPGIGYAHTFVIRNHFFITASLNGSLLFGPVDYRIESEESFSEWQANPSFDLRVAFGYNSELTYFGFSLVQEESGLRTIDNSIITRFLVGNARLNYVRRFKAGDKTQKFLKKFYL